MGNKKRVLIMDDDEKMNEALCLAYADYNDGKLKIPLGGNGQQYEIETESTSDEESVSRELRNYSMYDVFVVDRLFVDQYLDKEILQVLRDLHARSIRIICTAHYDPSDMKECMRLGAWDYIEKSTSEGSQDNNGTMFAVVRSTIAGLFEQTKAQSKMELDQQAHEYVRRYRQEIFSKYKGQFLAMRQNQEDKAVWEWVANNESLFGLYRDLKKKNENRDELHITHIGEMGGNENASIVR